MLCFVACSPLEAPANKDEKATSDTEEFAYMSDGVSKIPTDEEVKLAYLKAREAYF